MAGDRHVKKPQPWLGYAVNFSWPIGFVVIVVGMFLNGNGPLIVVGFLLMAPGMIAPHDASWRKYWDRHDERVRQWEAEQ
jgi:hypothetical protein